MSIRFIFEHDVVVDDRPRRTFTLLPGKSQPVDIDSAMSDSSEHPVQNKAISKALQDKAPIIINTATGSVASFSDGADDLPVNDLKIGIEPVQDLHGQSNPYTAGGGSNKWDEQWELGIWNGNGEKADAINSIRSKNYIPCSANTSYYVTYPTTTFPSGLIIRELNSNKGFLRNNIKYSNGTITTGNDCAYLVLCSFGADNVTTYNGGIAINYPSTVTAYSPYSNICPISGWTGANIYHEDEYDSGASAALSISWQSTAGTVYGGTLDVTTGVLTVTHGYIASYNGETLPGAWISSMDAYAVGTTPTTGAQVVYALASSQTYQLSPNELKTLLGDNAIWADTGDTTVEYRADSGLFIAKETAAIRSCIAPTEDGATASQAYAQGKFFFRGGNFCKAKTSIASGASFTLNTNYEITTIAAELYTAQH